VQNRPAHRSWLLTLILIALLTLRVGGAHLHLCFDGSEPPASLHLLDDGSHHDEDGASAPHHDVNLSVIDEALTKLGKASWDLPVFVAAAALLLTLLASPALLVTRRVIPPPQSPLYLLRPPLRGPPC